MTLDEMKQIGSATLLNETITFPKETHEIKIGGFTLRANGRPPHWLARIMLRIVFDIHVRILEHG